jgi:hypothetical protein
LWPVLEAVREGIEAAPRSDPPEAVAIVEEVTKPLCRVWMWFHHIRSPQKKRSITSWAKELELAGVCRTGYPGVLVVEGTCSGCAEYVSRLRRLRWAAMAVRDEEPIEAQALKGIGVEMIDGGSMGEIATRMDAAGLGETFRRVIMKML